MDWLRRYAILADEPAQWEPSKSRENEGRAGDRPGEDTRFSRLIALGYAARGRPDHWFEKMLQQGGALITSRCTRRGGRLKASAKLIQNSRDELGTGQTPLSRTCQHC